MPTEATRVQLVRRLSEWFASRNRTEYVDVRIAESGSRVSLVIIHGRTPKSLSVIRSASRRDRVSLVPDKHDFVNYEPSTGQLSVHAQYPAEIDFYRQAVGAVFFRECGSL